jgi:hypothetical protein
MTTRDNYVKGADAAWDRVRAAFGDARKHFENPKSQKRV